MACSIDARVIVDAVFFTQIVLPVLAIDHVTISPVHVTAADLAVVIVRFVIRDAACLSI